ncbi:MAG: hypothetical protein QXV69_05765 [Sulfolobaceae archaeon]
MSYYILEKLKNELLLSDAEIEFAINKAKGILLGYAMEYRACKILERYNFKNIKYVNLPTHDIEAEKEGEKYYIEVKATSKSPTREYTAHKVVMIALLDGTHLTLLMKPKEELYLTRQILSEPKRVLYDFFKTLRTRGEVEAIRFIENPIHYNILKSYQRVLFTYKNLLTKKIIELLNISSY